MFPTIKPITDKGGLVIVVVYKTKKIQKKSSKLCTSL